MNAKLALLVAAVGLCSDGNATTRPAGQPAATTVDEAVMAREVLAAARGAPRILCGLAARAVEANYGSGPWTPPIRIEDSSSSLRWALAHERATGAVPVLLAGLADTDACVRALAARLIADSKAPAATAGLLQEIGSA